MKDYFPNDEFQRCDPPCKKSDMNTDFMRRLNNAREYSGVPLVLTSAYRTRKHELDQGRTGTSSHTKGIAVDIQAATSRARHKIVSGLLRAGFNRIGIGRTFVHVDSDTAKPDSVMWDYYD